MSPPYRPFGADLAVPPTPQLQDAYGHIPFHLFNQGAVARYGNVIPLSHELGEGQREGREEWGRESSRGGGAGDWCGREGVRKRIEKGNEGEG